MFPCFSVRSISGHRSDPVSLFTRHVTCFDASEQVTSPKKPVSLSLSLASYADGTRARTLTAQQDDLTVTRWIRKGLNVYILCTKREKRWVDQTKRRTISSGYRAIGWTRRNTSDPVPVADTNLTGSLVSIGASKRVGFPDSRDGKLLIGLSILVFWEE